MKWHSTVPCGMEAAIAAKTDLSHAASANGAQIDAMTGEGCVAFTIIVVFGGR